MSAPIVLRGVLGWGNRKSGLEAYGPGGRWQSKGEAKSNAEVGDLLGDTLDRQGAGEGADLIVIAVPRLCGGDYPTMNGITTKLHAAVLTAVDEVMADLPAGRAS